MANSKTRKIVLVCCAVAAISMISPATSEGCAFLERLMPWNWCRSDTADVTYAPAYAVQYPVAAQICNYVPQTCYRTVMRTMPTTVYRPTSYCDPYTGCATTCYRPVTSYVRSAQFAPYTTYRPVWTTSRYTPYATSRYTPYATPCATSCNPCATSCSPCATNGALTYGNACGSACGSTTYVSPTNGCTSCAQAPVAPISPAPMRGIITQPPNRTTTPVIRQNAPTQPYRENKPIKPIPDKEVKGSSLGGPQLDGPATDRTTARFVRQATYQSAYSPSYQPVVNRAAANLPAFDYGGWRASNK